MTRPREKVSLPTTVGIIAGLSLILWAGIYLVVKALGA